MQCKRGYMNRNRIAVAVLKPKKIGFVLAAVALILVSAISPMTYADRFDEQINQLNKKNAANTEARNSLAVEAKSLEQTIAGLRTEIAAIERQISANKTKQASLKKKIAAAEAELERERAVLGVNIKQMYVEHDMTTFEMLAASKNLSDFLDRDQYRISVQANIAETMKRIETLKAELDTQKKEVDSLIRDQESMRSSLSAKRAETNRLLNLNKAQRAEFNGAIASNNKKISELKRQQAIENAKFNVGSISYSGSGSYPWANVPYPSSDPDPWGMYKRECVSYTAWKISSTGRHMPYWGGRGNAKLWDDNARAAGIPVDYTPRVGSIGVSNSGTYGHVVYVEKVHGDGTITVSQYNAGWDGRYSVVRRSASGLVFVHF